MKAALIIVNLILPGLGTVFMKKYLQGILQLALTLFAFLLWSTVFLAIGGFVVGAIAWVWALFVGINWTEPGTTAPPKTGIGR